MRLTARQIETIKQTIAEIFGETAKIWLFGSRADDNKRGGDIDLLIRLPARDDARNAKWALTRKIRLLARLEKRLGERKIDIVIETPDDARPIVRVAHQQGILL
uniref:Nucleotidyltransferase domain-containing protein n=1 Tax=Candidatus Kentrum sp. UNK TaxID=2126344 RepID=A0A450ZVN9_9GAMM|nr:MAG: Nucleotidyltransferase domain-containing protein [Candidatus Kentron sp. UNK]VFK69692.1 MAG: Nucleotidyltransferase domain-containing protein [Candidatus Kentron sp. UNK]